MIWNNCLFVLRKVIYKYTYILIQLLKLIQELNHLLDHDEERTKGRMQGQEPQDS